MLYSLYCRVSMSELLKKFAAFYPGSKTNLKLQNSTPPDGPNTQTGPIREYRLTSFDRPLTTYIIGDPGPAQRSSPQKPDLQESEERRLGRGFGTSEYPSEK